MATLRAGTWISVGLFIVIVSLLVAEIRFFAAIGILFILFGLGRLLFSRLRSPAPPQPEHSYHTQASDADGKKRCFVCGAHNSEKANFCGHCGHRLS